MAFNPMTEKGTPIDKQFRNWETVNPQPYDKEKVHPYTRARIILMNGIEVEAAMFKHQFHRHCTDPELQRKVAISRRVEQQQQKTINWMPPPNESPLEVTIGYEQVAVDLTARLARSEPDENVKNALDFALIEDFDHLYRYANLLDMDQGMDASRIVGDLTEIMPGRPTVEEHRHPMDSVRTHYDKDTADILTKLHVLTIVSGEQQTMNFYMNIGGIYKNRLGRGIYAEIAQIEEQHVTHYGSLSDPTESWYERLLMHEYNECYMYYSCMQSEPDRRIRDMWERYLQDEIEHLHIAAELMKQFEDRDPAEMLPSALPELTIFEPAKDYVRDILARQTELTSKDGSYVPVSKLPRDDRYFQFQAVVNEGKVPTQEVIEQRIRAKGDDYRLQTEGEHPVERLRARQRVAA